VGKPKALLDLGTGGSLAAYVGGSGSSGEVRVRVRCTTTAGRFYARADYARLSFTAP
jgi:hypothetical protein